MHVEFKEHILGDGERIGVEVEKRRDRITVRRLSEHAYWMEVIGYHTTVLIGERAALLIDPLDGARTGELLTAIRSTFNRDITDVVYSHGHSDHIGGIDMVTASSEREVRIHASVSCAQAIKRRGLFADPHVVHDDFSPFDFEGIPVQLVTIGGHTTDTTAIHLPTEHVVHAVDLVHPTQAEFPLFGGAVDMASYEESLHSLLKLDWRVMTAGHGDIGYKKDVEVLLAYMGDLRRFTVAAIDEALAAPPVTSTVPNARVSSLHLHVQTLVAEALKAEWGDRLPGLEFAGSTHAERMLNEVLYYNATTNLDGSIHRH